LPDNRQMLNVFQKSGLPVSTRRDAGSLHVTLRLI
jgi:hypothetical protein